MKNTIRGLSLAVALAATSCAVLGAPSYQVTVTGASVRSDIVANANGQFAGAAYVTPPAPFPYRAFRFANGALEDLGTLGGEWSVVKSMNGAGQVAGESPDALGYLRAYVWSPSTGMVNLGSLGGPATRVAYIDPSGRVVGDATDDGAHERAYLWTAGTGLVNLEVPYRSFATRVNAAGEVVGYFMPSPFSFDTHAFVWSASTGVTDLGTLGGSTAFARTINDAGQVAGHSTNAAGQSRAFIWSRTAGMEALGTLGGCCSVAHALTPTGVVLGGSTTAGGTMRTFVWSSSTGMQDVGTFGDSADYFPVAITPSGDTVLGFRSDFIVDPFAMKPFVWKRGVGLAEITLGGANAAAYGMNAAGHVVGWALTSSGQQRAFLYDGTATVDLNGLLSGAPPGLELTEALAISDDGSIAAQSNQGLVILKPVEEQGSTPAGTDVQVELNTTLPDGTPAVVDLAFDNVTVAGSTSVTATVDGPPPPAGFKLGTPPVFYDISTTAAFTGNIHLCFGWTEGQFSDESAIRMWHMEGATWIDVTTTVDTANNTACGVVNSLSPFALMETAFQFEGFYAPVANLPDINGAKAGSAIPVKFSLGGDRGLGIFAAGYPRSVPVACGAASSTVGDETASAGGSGLSYDASTGTYNYPWKTEKVWSGSCRQLVVRFRDGTERRASFSFR